MTSFIRANKKAGPKARRVLKAFAEKLVLLFRFLFPHGPFRENVHRVRIRFRLGGARVAAADKHARLDVRQLGFLAVQRQLRILRQREHAIRLALSGVQRDGVFLYIHRLDFAAERKLPSRLVLGLFLVIRKGGRLNE